MERMWRNQRQLKAICVLLILAMTLGLLPGAAWAEENGLAGSGTAEDPYLLADVEDLKTFRDKVNAEVSSSLCARLTADINLENEEWMPFNPASGYATEAYAGTFDGDGHTIKGLSINAATANQGLFGIINGATVKNLNVEGSVASSNNYVGGIVGKVQQGTIENCSFRGTVTTTKSGGYAGGITGTTVHKLRKFPAVSIPAASQAGQLAALSAMQNIRPLKAAITPAQSMARPILAESLEISKIIVPQSVVII